MDRAMKKLLCALFLCIFILTFPVMAAEDYSFLDEMTKGQLEALQTEIAIRLENMKESTIPEEYLVTIEITPENFDEYFELTKCPRYNAFGEEEETL